MLEQVQSEQFQRQLADRNLLKQNLYSLAVCFAYLLDGSFRILFKETGKLKTRNIAIREEKTTVTIYEQLGIYYLLLKDPTGQLFPKESLTSNPCQNNTREGIFSRISMAELEPPEETIPTEKEPNFNSAGNQHIIQPSSTKSRPEENGHSILEPMGKNRATEGSMMVEFIRELQSIFKGHKGLYIEGGWAFML